MQSTYRLVMRSGPSVGKVYPLDRAEAFVGRDLNNDIVINDPEISRRHARLYVQGNGFVLEDLGSTNGTFVNGQRLLGPYVMRPGDTITFGERLNMVFESTEVDQDATMVSPSARAYPPAQPEPEYPPQRQSVPPEPSYSPPQAAQQAAQQQPIPAYSGQVPGSYPAGNYSQGSYPAGNYPANMNPVDAPPVKKRAPTIWIVLIIIVVLLCLCVAAFLFFAPKSIWCLLPIWPAGACP